MAARRSKAVWKRDAPATARHVHLSAKKKASARASAARAGRPYPNLIDNMRAARTAGGKKRVGKKTAETRAAKKTAKKRLGKRAKKKAAGAGADGTGAVAPSSRNRPVRENPKGGLTQAGREFYARTQGAHLKPGVKKSVSTMSRQEMHRKGSWAVRFYGRAGKLPPLVGADGRPTRYALSAAAWGEPVPKTVTAARRIAAKGRRLLARYAAARASTA